MESLNIFLLLNLDFYNDSFYLKANLILSYLLITFVYKFYCIMIVLSYNFSIS